MIERLSDRLDEHLATAQGRRVSLRSLREALNIAPGSKDDTNLRGLMLHRVTKKIVKPSGLDDGVYKVVRQVKPVQVFGRERREPIQLLFPKDFDTKMEMSFAQDIVLRGGDLILLSGISNYGKTALCINFCGENINANPVLMGNEYTTIDGEPTPRFLNRLDNMDWVEWENGGKDKFTLLPVREDYAENIVRDRINIIDWINLDASSLFGISAVSEGIKRELGDEGIGIIAIQKAEGSPAGRGGQFTKDFADVELLIDKFGRNEVLLTIGKVKEYTKPVTGRTFAYGIAKGVRIINFREVVKCHGCWGKGYLKSGGQCADCIGRGFVDKTEFGDEGFV